MFYSECQRKLLILITIFHGTFRLLISTKKPDDSQKVKIAGNWKGNWTLMCWRSKKEPANGSLIDFQLAANRIPSHDQQTNIEL